MSKLVNKILEVAFHRNGVGGRGFYAVRFTGDIQPDDGEMTGCKPTPGIKNAKWLGILTDDKGECYVICTDLLETCGVKFAGGNSWRGDRYEPLLRKAIQDAEETKTTAGGIRIGPFVLPTE